MKVEDYKLADCTLFRRPPIDFSEFNKAIETALVRAWESGNSASRTVNSMVNDSALVDSLKTQIEKNLSFQRQHALDGAAQQSAEMREQYEQQQLQEMESLSSTYGTVTAEQQKAYEEARKKAEESHKGYSAAQQQLNETRNRIKAKLESFGGRKGFEALMQINQMVTELAKESTKPGTYAAQPAVSYTDTKHAGSQPSSPDYAAGQQQSLQRALDLATAKGEIDPLKGKTLEAIVGTTAPEDLSMQAHVQKGRFKTMMSAFWGYLTLKPLRDRYKK